MYEASGITKNLSLILSYQMNLYDKDLNGKEQSFSSIILPLLHKIAIFYICQV